MHEIPDHFEIALTLATKFHGTRRIVCASYDDFKACSYAFYLIAEGNHPPPLSRDVALPIRTVYARLTMDAVLPSGRIVAYALYKTTVFATELRNTIRWPRSREKRFPKRITIMPDFGGACAWDQEGVAIAWVKSCFSLLYRPDRKLFDLDDAFDDWLLLYEKDVSLDPEKNLSFDWADFHAKGIELCENAQQLLGHRYQIFYNKITELDPPADENSLVVFFPD